LRAVTLSKKHFTVQKAFSFDTYIAQTFDQVHDSETSNVAIRFSPFQSQWIREHQWHPSQEIDELKDGSLLLKMQVGALDAVKRWVMRYGSEAEVLEPQELREMIKYELLATAKMYEDVRVQKVESLSLF
jgi:predicted DNA-binding transcriptional regulator YafY